MLGLADAARGEEVDHPEPANRWVPGLAVIAGGLVDRRDGRVESTELGFDDGDSLAPIAFVGLSGELSTPVLLEGPGRPRLFVHGDVSWTFDTDEALANQDDPGVPEVPPVPNFPVLGVPGQGQALRVEAMPLVVSAGAGVSLAVRAGDREIRIKPSIEWLWQEDKLNTLFGLAESEGANPDFCDPCRIASIDSNTHEDFHSLGPGLELEFDAARQGDLRVTVFASGQAYRLLSDRKVETTSTAVWQTNGSPSVGRAPTTVRASYERDAWSYRVAVGLRLLWSPTD